MINFKKTRLLSYTVDGEDMLPGVEDPSTDIQDDQGLVDYSHIGLNIGIRYYFKVLNYE
jgi:hypothetical protein